MLSLPFTLFEDVNLLSSLVLLGRGRYGERAQGIALEDKE